MATKLNKMLVNALIAGLLIMVVGTVVGYVAGKFTKTDLPPTCKDWNKNYIMEISLFFTGFVAMLVAHWAGLCKRLC